MTTDFCLIAWWKTNLGGVQITALLALKIQFHFIGELGFNYFSGKSLEQKVFDVFVKYRYKSNKTMMYQISKNQLNLKEL